MTKNVVVIGGGASGIEASRRLRDLGYSPVLVEKEDHLGGHLASWNRLFPQMIPAKDILKSLTSDMKGIEVFLNTEVISINRLKDSYVVKFSNGLSAQVKAILITTGFTLFPAQKKQEYGYGIYDRVITNADLEAWFNGNKDKRVTDPQVIGFVHCVGSRDEKAGNRQCSKVCCATAVKQAIEIKEKFPDAVVYCFYMDLRMFGRGYEDMYLKAQKDYGIRFLRGRVSEVSEDINGRLVVKADDTLLGKPVKISMDLLVLMSGMIAPESNMELSKMLKVLPGEDGFFSPANAISNPTLSNRDGVFFAGAATGPKTMPETLSEGRAAALEIDSYLKRVGD